ncbi:MAG TPA: hypothetical protein VGY55_00540 [Pirellulales bacterium]|nr:hypothetical protein [Pirellulales bacterium]
MFAIAVVAALWLLHAPLLRGVGRFLVADQPLADADFIVILPSMASDRVAIDSAIKRVRRGDATRLILFQMPPTRSERCGAWPEYGTAIREYLKSRGIAAGSIVFLPGPSRDSWEAARALGQWLDQRPTPRLEVLCQQFRGRYERRVFNSVLPSDVSNRLHFAAVSGRFDETNWWHDREGIQMVFQDYVQLAFIELHGETKSSVGEWTLEQYEQSLPPAQPAK